MVYFELSVIVNSKRQADTIGYQLGRHPLNINNSILIPLRSYLTADDEGYWWVSIKPDPDVVGREGPHSQELASLFSVCGNELYKRLKVSPSFEYAKVGFNNFNFRTKSEIVFNGSISYTSPGIVISESIWEEAGRPSQFQSFNSHTKWIPYNGEKLISP